jgi:colanic acid biosynthesis glycosyl transferase WcaI
MKIQLWSCYYAPEPQGNGPVAAVLAAGLRDRGHEVLVVAAHPHYPEPAWGVRWLPYREQRDGVNVLRLPVWPGRDGGFQRVRHDLGYTLAQSMVAPLLPKPDVLIGTTPCFPALAPAMLFAKARRIPWAMWTQDIVADAALTTGQLPDGLVMRTARRFERASYASADRIVVVSEAFRNNLLAKGVPEKKIQQISNPAAMFAETPNQVGRLARAAEPQILAMGNIGLSQGLDRIVDAFQESLALQEAGAKLVISGTGIARAEVQARVRTSRITMPGVVYDNFAGLLRQTVIGLVTQRPDVDEFNLPSKLMTYLAHGIPVVASVRLDSEAARIVRQSGGGWVTDSCHPSDFAIKAAELLAAPEELVRAGRRGFEFARQEFSPHRTAQRFESVLFEMREQAT